MAATVTSQPVRLYRPRSKACVRQTSFKVRCTAAPALDVKGAKPQTKTLALKEWSVTIGALAKAQQTVLFRKGGIREPTFKPEAKEFLMFPTAFHTDAALLKPQYASLFQAEARLDPRTSPSLDLGLYCQVTGAWTSSDAAVLQLLDDFHVWTPQYLETRLKWRAGSPLTLLEVRSWALQPPLTLSLREDYFGCFSWVDLTEVAGGRQWLEGARPCLSDDEFRARQARLREKLGGLKVETLEL